MSSRFEPVIGLEVHAQLLTRTKAFLRLFHVVRRPAEQEGVRGVPRPPGRAARAQRRRRRDGRSGRARPRVQHPRALHLLAREELLLSGPAEGLPRSASTTSPFSDRGHLLLEGTDGAPSREVGITRVHMEEDAGKNLHDRQGSSVVDLNRSGVPSSRSSATPTSGAAPKPRPTSAPSATSSSSSASTTATSRRAASAATPTSPSGRSARPRSERASS